jgi:hypothetical protein
MNTNVRSPTIGGEVGGRELNWGRAGPNQYLSGNATDETCVGALLGVAVTTK